MASILQDQRFANRLIEIASFQVEIGAAKEFFYSTIAEPALVEICHCGHPRKSHAQACKINGYTCGCQEFSRVLWSEDPRPFYRLTEGPARKHALDKALRMSEELGIRIEFTVSRKCRRGPFHGPAYIVGLSKRNTLSFLSPPKNEWLCQDCAGLSDDY